MTDTLHIEFANDMPVAAVEVVAPDLRVVSRTMLSAGRSKDIEVPSEQSFLRVHLPNGRVVTLHDPGNLTRVISRSNLRITTRAAASSATISGGFVASVEDDAPSHISEPRRRGGLGGSGESAPTHVVSSDEAFQLPAGGEVRILHAPDAIGRSQRAGAEFKWTIAMPWTSRPFQVRYVTDAGVAITVALPASTQTVHVRRKGTPNKDEMLCVKLRTQSEHADAILSYMYRGDMYAAQALTEWVREAETMVLSDHSDPYSGVVGAYLLLRLRQFDRMKDWVREIADRFDFLPDGCVIWAWQQIQMSRGPTTEAREYLFQACARGLPVYSEGLRLLLDGLSVLGEAGHQEHERMMKLAADVVWTSPLTTTYDFAESRPSRRPPTVEVTFGS